MRVFGYEVVKLKARGWKNNEIFCLEDFHILVSEYFSFEPNFLNRSYSRN